MTTGPARGAAGDPGSRASARATLIR